MPAPYATPSERSRAFAHTTSCWLTIPAALMGMLPFASDDRRDRISGLAFALEQSAQLLLMCDRHDIGIEIDTGEQVDPAVGVLMSSGQVLEADRSPRIFVYDNYPGGIGFSQPFFRVHGGVLQNTRRFIEECDRESGCPGRVGPVGQTGPLAKVAALRMLALLLDDGDAAPASRGTRAPGVAMHSLSERLRGIVKPACVRLEHGGRSAAVPCSGAAGPHDVSLYAILGVS